MTDRERQLLLAIDLMQDVLRELKYEMDNNFTANGEVLPERWAELLDSAEVLGNWDPLEDEPPVGYEVRIEPAL